MDTNLYRPATPCNMNMPVYTPFSTSASNKFIQKHHIIIHNPPSKCPFKTHLEMNYCVLGDIPLSTTKLSGTVGNILKKKSITKSKLFSSEQSKESVECTFLSPTDPQLRPYEVVEGLNKGPVFVKTENKALVCSREVFSPRPCASLIPLYCI